MVQLKAQSKNGLFWLSAFGFNYHFLTTDNGRQTPDIERFRSIRVLLNSFFKNLMKQFNGFFTELRRIQMKIHFYEGHLGIQMFFKRFRKSAVGIGIIKGPSFPVKGAPAF